VIEPIIRVDKLVKTYRGDVRALDELSLDVERGIIHGLLGPNGAGKTTLIRVLTTLLTADSGSARIAGKDVTGDPVAVRALIGLAGQHAAVDDHLTGRENIDMVGRLYGQTPAESRRRAADMLVRIGLTDAGDRQVKTYSGGMRRRLDLAASLVGRPQVLFLDEPTTGLDPASRRDMWELIRSLVEDGTTVLLTTQYLDEADQLADRVTVIDHGRVIGEGRPDELKKAVGSSTVEITVHDAHKTSALDALKFLGAHAADSSGDTVVVPAADGTTTLRKVLHNLDTANVEVEDIGLRKPTLDDVFLSLTGHRAATPTAPEGKPA
jgi:daunorubicin resistance ABC transporter ATP-binding subunit